MAQTTRKSKGTLVLRESVEQVWLAGLGALALTEEEGSKLFKTLVKRGEGFERTAKKQLQKAVATAKEAPGTALTRIEQGLDDTISGVLDRVGMPTKREINGLARRVEGLSNTIERRNRRPAARRPRRKSPAAAPPAAPTA
jgi:poly(hydroxyalkanoate) granule-associated protein